jgi:hypothetical protein
MTPREFKKLKVGQYVFGEYWCGWCGVYMIGKIIDIDPDGVFVARMSGSHTGYETIFCYPGDIISKLTKKSVVLALLTI